ncbi:MAG TPA: VWA domain-containing protein [Pyrinomonadaceae bacterium]|nr:VWA domain-containing protein [Pyrinomonadaceae bacterium]
MRRTRTRTLLCCLALMFTALPAAAQDTAKKGSEKEKGKAAQPFEVRLNVTVLDAAGRPVTDLRAEDFQISEDGAAQQVTHFARKEGPPVFGLVVDNTGSLRSLMNTVVGFGNLVVEGSDPRSEIFVERFVSSDRITMMQDFTTNKAALTNALDEMYVEGGQSAITDALYLGAEHLARRKGDWPPTRRRALVLITDGEDRANKYKHEQLLATLRETDAQIFVVALTKAANLQVVSPDRAIAHMNRIALESGGALWLPDKKTDMAGVAREVIQQLNAPYTLGFAPANQKRDGSTRSLAVVVPDGPNGEPRRVVVRGSYTAPKK